MRGKRKPDLNPNCLMDDFLLRVGNNGSSSQDTQCGERRGNTSVYHRSYFDYFSFSCLWVLSVGFWINRSVIYHYSYIWILTLKRICAEGLQQKRKKEVNPVRERAGL
jgi:hypothetical protein